MSPAVAEVTSDPAALLHHSPLLDLLAPPEISALDQAEQWALATPGLSGIGREDDGAIFGTRERYNPHRYLPR